MGSIVWVGDSPLSSLLQIINSISVRYICGRPGGVTKDDVRINEGVVESEFDHRG